MVPASVTNPTYVIQKQKPVFVHHVSRKSTASVFATQAFSETDKDTAFVQNTRNTSMILAFVRRVLSGI
jgi:hypothetical protein